MGHLVHLARRSLPLPNRPLPRRALMHGLGLRALGLDLGRGFRVPGTPTV